MIECNSFIHTTQTILDKISRERNLIANVEV